MFGNSLLPPVLGLNSIGMATLCVFIGTILLMLFADITWACLFSILAYATSSVYTQARALELSVGHNIFWYMVLSMIILGEVVESGLIRRFAILMLTRPITRKNPWAFVVMLFFAMMLISFFMEPTSIMLLFIALMKEIFDVVGVKKGSRVGEIMMLGALVWCMTANGATPIGHAIPNVLTGMFAQADLGNASFLQFILVGVLGALIIFAIGVVLYKFVFKLDASVFRNYDPNMLIKSLTPVSKQEKVVGTAYAILVVLWLLPTFFKNVPELYAFLNTQLGTNAPLLVVIGVLCMLRVDGKPALDLGKQFKNVPWIACLIVGVNMMLAASLQNPEAGITAALADAIGPLLKGIPPLLFVLIINLLVIVMTNFSANLLVAVLFATISITLIQGGVITGVNPLALMVTISVTSNLGFATPAAAAPAALIAGDGWVPAGRQLADSFIISLVTGIIGTIAMYYIGCLVF